jgi:hypothetical protein
VTVGCGAAAVSLAYGDPRYVTYDSVPLAETQVVHNYGNFMIPASNLTEKIDVWHYQSPSLRRFVDGDELTITFDQNARVAVIEQEEPYNPQVDSGNRSPRQPTADQQAIINTRCVAIGFDSALVSLALGRPDRVTLRTDSNGPTVIWHYASMLLNRASDRTTIQDRFAVAFDSSGQVFAYEQEVPLDFKTSAGPRPPDHLTQNQQDLVKDGQVAIGFDPILVKRAFGVPDRVTLRTSTTGQMLVWHFEASRSFDTRFGWPSSSYPTALVRFGVTVSFDESGRVSAINENIGVRAE